MEECYALDLDSSNLTSLVIRVLRVNRSAVDEVAQAGVANQLATN